MPAFAQQQQFGEIGDLKLVSGEVLRECRVGYRTFGQLNVEKSNVIVYPTWANGRTEQMEGAAAGLRDAGYYVVAIDALSNGVSSSPSNSRLQPRMKFPRITMRDMVESPHELLTRVLSIYHIKAVMGVSMGAMQTFQWVSSYPEFMDKAVASRACLSPQIPNFFNPQNADFRICVGLTIAIEPMVNAGLRAVETLEDGWTIVTRDRLPSAHFEHTIAITDHGPVVLTCGPNGEGWAMPAKPGLVYG
jgi:homoserine acetyltransferase